ncbi:Lpp/OprI family alanine-zipper lipoprotein [Moritella dasanensis]|uniref:Lpp/OprI family alanine-zipper lipoprotein n=1 Tax=Moritella dasanensis TaxID=428031 RepID=UPI000310B655|nr:Lpp/OprI family alanine-zipper lipoprotein [Moritella dasanensis]
MNNKLLIAGAIATSVFLGGCASNEADVQKSVGSLTSEVTELTSQVQNLESEHAGLKSQLQSATDAAMQAQEDAQRANSRIDNIAASYSK